MNNLFTDNQLPSDLEFFWKDLNQKLFAMGEFHNDLGNLFSDKMYFSASKGVGAVSIDFSLFDLPHLKIEKIATLNLNGKCYPLSMKEYAKLSIVGFVTPRNVRGLRSAYNMLLHIAGFLNERVKTELNDCNIEEFHLSFLTQSLNAKGWFTRLSPPAYRSTYEAFNFIDNRVRLQALGVSGVFSHALTKRKVWRTLEYVCRSVLGCSRLEYKKGGSLNTLTLEMGQYYIDHLKQVYENDYLYALVCQSALRIVKKKHLISGKDSFKLKVLADTIQGKCVSQKVKAPNSLSESLRLILKEQYFAYFEKVQSLKESNIYLLIQKLKLEMRFDGVEVIRVLMLQKYYGVDAHKTPESVWQSYLHSLNKTEVSNNYLKGVGVNEVYSMMSDIVGKSRLDEVSLMSKLMEWVESLAGERKHLLYSELKFEIERIEDAMTSLAVAWLGYRSSELDFPLNAIHIEPNLDVLDNSHVPFRFKLKWLVPKTNKKTKIDREITSQCYQIAVQLCDILNIGKGAPCLYSYRMKAANLRQGAPKSHILISSRLRSNWLHFAMCYKPFVDIHKLHNLSALAVNDLDEEEKNELIELQNMYDLSTSRAQHLLNTRNEVLRDIEKLKCTSVLGNDSDTQLFKSSLSEFCETGSVSNQIYSKIIMECLSQETKQLLLSGNVDLKELTTINSVNSELLRDVRYPSPHAFRHIWAEAVITRYQGDVGAVIRHQFCHLDDSFFMAYVRDKEVKALLKSARMKVLNSIVDTLLQDAQQIGKEYIGGFSRYVKKATSLTEVVRSGDLSILREKIMGRVIDIQPSYFATCIPREGTENRAKCSELGDINPQNARPSFCLGCTNALITSGNLRGIWVTIQPFVKECLSDDLMSFMLQSHLPILRSGYKRIKELRNNTNAESVDKILSFIDSAIKSVGAKMEREGSLYDK